MWNLKSNVKLCYNFYGLYMDNLNVQMGKVYYSFVKIYSDLNLETS